jgi:hypothetical protein
MVFETAMHISARRFAMKTKILASAILATATFMLVGCSGGDSRYYSAYPTDRYVSSSYFDGNPYAFDSDIYYDPYAGYRPGYIYPRYRVRPY